MSSLFYRGCWHRVTQDFPFIKCHFDLIYKKADRFKKFRHVKKFSSDHARAHCQNFHTAAFRFTNGKHRSFSYLLWLIFLSDQLWIIYLVINYKYQQYNSKLCFFLANFSFFYLFIYTNLKITLILNSLLGTRPLHLYNKC